jgi:hypothetical protein
MIFDGGREDWEPPNASSVLFIILLGAAICLLGMSLAFAQDARVVPDPTITPGFTNLDVTEATIGSTICVSGWTKTIRPPASYTTALKIKQLAEMGYADQNPSDYEEDHLISLEIGGHPTDPRNLWPEFWNGPWGAHVKDKIENRLKVEVCAGRLPLSQAQRMISYDWREAYCLYFSGPPCLSSDR